MTDQVESLADIGLQVSKDNINTVLDDFKTIVKNELRSSINSLNSQLDDVKSSISQLETTNKQLLKENNTIKTMLGSLQSEMKKSKSQQQIQNVSISTQTPSDNTEKKHFKHSLTQTSTSDCELPFNTNYTHPNETNEHCAQTNAHAKSQSSDQSPIKDSAMRSTFSKSPTPITEMDDNLNYNVSTFNSFSLLDSDTHPAYVSKSQSKSEENNQQIDDSKKVKSSPQDVLKSMTIPEKATMLLVGDSVTRYINPRKLAPRYERLFKICVPGMTVEDLHVWLLSLSVNTKLKDVIFHVGVNSCPSGPVSFDTWSSLASLAHQVFPEARVSFSSIVPAKGKHQFNNCILPSNRNLKATCDRFKLHFIDHQPTFAADIHLYSDIIHPNPKGTIHIAENIKCLWRGQQSKGNHIKHRMNHRASVPNDFTSSTYTSNSTPFSTVDHEPTSHNQSSKHSPPHFMSLHDYPPLISTTNVNHNPSAPSSSRQNHQYSIPPMSSRQCPAPYPNDHFVNCAGLPVSSPTLDMDRTSFPSVMQFHPHAQRLLQIASQLLLQQSIPPTKMSNY